MKIAALFVATISGVSAFTSQGISNRASSALSAEPVPLANGAMSFNRVCREWRCKYEGDKATSESLEAIAKIVDEKLPEIKKASDDICQLRLDFQTFNGFVVGASGACTDTFAVAGQSGKNPPSICGTNTGYHSRLE